MANRNPDRNAQ